MVKLTQKNRSLLVFTVVLVLACVFAEVFVFTHLDHDCCGEDCLVCLEIQIIQNALNGLGRCGVAAALAGIAAGCRAWVKPRALFCLPPLSPVSLHTQSNT